ncbi:MAG: IS5 family transposase [Bacteroidota bacterium]
MTKIASKTVEKQEKRPKDKYRVTNWSAYNRSLIKRGDITIWISEQVINGWYYEGPDPRGGQYVYSDECIECLLQIKAVFHLGYRQLEGFCSSILKLLNFVVDVPCYSQICRRARDMEIDIAIPKTKGSIYLVVDSTGLKVYGEGEWKTRKHGISKRRTWRKLHLGVDEKTGFIHAQVLTENGKGDGDAQQVEKMLEQVKTPIDKFSGDGAYDSYEIWELLKSKGIEGIIPPQENAIYWVDEFDELLDLDRNEILEKIEAMGRKEWKKTSGYHRRSLSETAMNRFKTIFGPVLYSRILEKQKNEAAIKIKCLNKMTGLGMPISEKIAV